MSGPFGRELPPGVTIKDFCGDIRPDPDGDPKIDDPDERERIRQERLERTRPMGPELVMRVVVAVRDDFLAVVEAIQASMNDREEDIYGPGSGLDLYARAFVNDYANQYLPAIEVPSLGVMIVFGKSENGTPYHVEVYITPASTYEKDHLRKAFARGLALSLPWLTKVTSRGRLEIGN